MLTLAKVLLDDKTYRIISTHFPPISVFESCLDPTELQDAYLLEGLTNDRLQDSIGELLMVAEEDRVSGPGTTPIMASFTHFGQASRFTNGNFGVYYAALDLDTAVEETKFWQARLLKASNEPEMTRDMRVYCSNLLPSVGALVDLRNDDRVHDLDDYGYAQGVAANLRSQREYGIFYRSVRHEGGECVAVFRPTILSPTTQSVNLRYYWDGSKISRVERVSTYGS